MLVLRSLAGFPEVPFPLSALPPEATSPDRLSNLIYHSHFPFSPESPLYVLYSKIGVSSDEDVPYKMEIWMFPHNQSGLAKPLLAGHIGNPV